MNTEENDDFNYLFDHCLIKLDPDIDTENNHYENIILNQSPDFIDNLEDDFHLSEDSPAIDAGKDENNFRSPGWIRYQKRIK